MVTYASTPITLNKYTEIRYNMHKSYISHCTTTYVVNIHAAVQHTLDIRLSQTSVRWYP